MASDRQPNLAGSARLFTAGASRTRGGRNTSRIALLLSLMLVAGALTIPALAKPVEPGITSPEAGAEFEKSQGGDLSLRAQASNGTKDVAWSLWIGEPGPDGSGDEQTVTPQLEHFDSKTGLLEVDIRLADLASSENYYFVFEENPDDPDSPRYAHDEVTFSIFDDMDTCTTATSDANCQVTAGAEGGPSITANAPGNPKGEDPSSLKLGLGDTTSDGIASAVFDACRGELTGNQRLAGSVSHLIPTEFTSGSNVVVELLIPKDSIDEDTDRGTKTFQVCIAPTVDEVDEDADQASSPYSTEYGLYQSDLLGDGDTGLVGPILLDDCGAAEQTACVVGRERTGSADLLITYRIPAVDPWMM